MGYPNGWAPLQWIAVKGLQNYGMYGEANDIADRWLGLNQKYTDKPEKCSKIQCFKTQTYQGIGW